MNVNDPAQFKSCEIEKKGSPEPGEQTLVYQLCENCRQKELEERIER